MEIVLKLHEFHQILEKYINGGCLLPLDCLISVISTTIPFIRNSMRIVQQYQNLNTSLPSKNDTSLRLRVEVYRGNNPYILKMMAYLERFLKDDLVGAYVHGSLGTYEEIAYSDFDVLAILKDEVFESPKRLAGTARKLNSARTIMLDFDPLQHHGWFVLSESDLRFYCNAYFPVELFKYAKSLFDDRGLELEIALRESSFEARTTFEKMANAIIGKIANRRYPTNVYQLKGLLSQFMLLPAFYVQARDRRGIYKKESFDLARVDFDSADWAIMDDVSEIRTNWNYEISPLKKRLMCHPHVLSRYFAKNFAPAIPEKIGRVLTAEFYARMAKLASLMKEKRK